MTLEAVPRKFSFDNEPLDLAPEEGTSVGVNLASLANNQFRLITDCDNRDFKGNVIKGHNFDFLVKQSPFQLTPQLTPQKLDSTVEEKSKASDSTFSLSKKSNLGQLELPPSSEKDSAQNKRVFILSEYNPKQKTFPRGILKVGERQKFADKLSDNSLMIRRQLSVGITTKTSNFERDVMTTMGNESDEAENLRSNMRKAIFISRVKNKEETDIEKEDDQEIKKKQGIFKSQLDKVKKFLAIKRNASK